MLHYDLTALALRDRHCEMLNEAERARARRAGAANRGNRGSFHRLGDALHSLLG